MKCILGHWDAWDISCNDCTPDDDCLNEKGPCPCIDWISTTIKRFWLDKILNGEKKHEYKGFNKFWWKRIERFIGKHDKDLGLNLLCGQESVKFFVVKVSRKTPVGRPFDIDGVPYKSYYDIEVGDRIK